MKKSTKKVIQVMIQPDKCPVNELSGIQVVCPEIFHSNVGGTKPCQQSLILKLVSTGPKVSAC